MAKVILKAQDLDGFLTTADKAIIQDMNGRYDKVLERFTVLSDQPGDREKDRATDELIALYNEMGHAMQEIVRTSRASRSTPS